MPKEKFLADFKLTKGTGLLLADAIYHALNDIWGIAAKVVALGFDTTSVNSGKNDGACLHLERSLPQPVLWFPCMHHVLKLVLKGYITTHWKTQ